ncbi:RHS repeat-associated protein [Krasilnikovia cinnamomea]|uniref:RHS repeat-associated protein n=1 Tax=Krasilnikovia cinnamomea TaxID=349313 RepID=A0A4Q7ZIT2_9ACTN|nr:LamG-like jellyroll fold domain-containing protein [Krasilnikovia cinnamomea]RZU50762.1 RHS repeat-associated protein [Krasilnikovia cinnamomea]
MRRAAGKIAVATAVVFGLTVAAPVGAVRDPELPVSWLWSWVSQRPAWAKPDPVVPQQKRGPGGSDRPATTADTTAQGGAGRAPKPAPGTLDSYQPYDPNRGRKVTPDADLGFDAKTSERDEDKSTARSDVFDNADGSVTAKTYTGPVNFRGKDGTFQPIDADLEKRADGRLHMAANSLDASLAAKVPVVKAPVEAPGQEPGQVAPSTAPSAPADAPAKAPDAGKQLATLKLPTGESVGYTLDGAAPVTPTVDGNTATYPGILPQTDLELQTFDSGIKETFILRSKDAPSSWTFPLALKGLTPRLAGDGSIELRNADGKAVAWFPKGWMQDSKVDPRSGAPAESGGVTYQLSERDGVPVLHVEADRAWLDDPARVYPVRVDPTATTGTTGDVYVDNDNSTTNQNGDNLPVGTYNGGTVKARSFIHFDEFDDDGFKGKRITKAVLKLFLSWTYSCTVDRAFDVRASTESWTVAGLTNGGWDGPAYSGSIGSLTVTDPGAACTNTGGNRSQGKWVSVNLNPATIDGWSKGNPNYGLALTASESDSNAWKRFTSANYNSGSHKPVLELTYATNVAPQVDVRYPGNNSVVNTLTPELLVKGHDSDNWPAQGLSYVYTVLSADGKTTIATSPAVAGTWTVPAGKLAWNTTYLYTVKAYDKVTYSTATPAYAFTTAVPQPTLTSDLAQNGGKGFDASTGNYTTSATDANVATVGPSLAITRSYNSLDPRRDNAFGTGWSSILDTRATRITDTANSVQSVRITYPTGEEVAFGRNSNGTFTPPSGRFSTLTEQSSGGTVTGYTLTDKDATVYTFGRALTGGKVFRLTSIKDANNRALTVAYDAAGNPTTLTSASGRTLKMGWETPAGATAPHVSWVATDPTKPGDWDTANTWSYGYTEDRLTKVCQPDNWSQCWTYDYDTTSQYANAVLNVGPESYWPLGDAAGSVAAKSVVLSNAGMDNARYNFTTSGHPGPLAGGTATATGFNGTSSFVQLPSGLVADGQYQSVSMWFNTTTPGGVLFSYNGDPLSKGTTTGNYTPALYIDKNGKLRGELYIGNAAAAMQSNTVVTDGKWHHVVLAGEGDSQTMYIDGVAKATLAGTIKRAVANVTETVNIGGGYVGGLWPDHVNTGASPAKATYFKGSISDVAFFNSTLDASTVATLNASGRTAQPVLSKVTRPSGGVTATVGYDKVTGKVSTVVDENGGTWRLANPTVAGSSLVYAAAVLGAKPKDYWRLGDTDVTDAVNEVAGGQATYNSVTLNTAGKFGDTPAASFNGTSSYLELPAEDVPTTGPNTIEMWFKLPAGNTKGGVLFGYQVDAIDEAATSGWTPALYVGTDGKLRGGLWTGSAATPMTAPTAVNDGKWHHVALTATTNAQALYLDGAVAAVKSGTVIATEATHAYVGAGRWAGGWPGRTTDTGWWPGQISDVAFYDSALNGDQVKNHVDTVKQTAPVAMTMVSGVATAIPMPVSQVAVTTPTGGQQVSSYDLVNGNRIVAQSDVLGNTTMYGYDVGGFASMVYDPNGALTQTLQDARGNTKQSITCQDQSANKCSSVYFTYFPDATSTNLAPNPKNDALLTVRDGRSASATDDTYLTSNTYDDQGNLTTVTDPLKRVTRTVYTDANSVAADGGTPPAGLPTKVTTPGGATQTVTYFKSGDVAQVTEPNGKITKFTYDGLGQVLTETEISGAYPQGLVSTTTYDRMGRKVTETDPAVTNRVTGAVHTRVSTTVYDVDGNPVEERTEDATGGDAARVEKHGYNQYGQEVSSTTPGGATTTFTYDAAGRLVDQTGPDGVVTHSEYDAEGNLLSTTLRGYTGDPNNPSDARDLVLERNSYDPAGRLATVTDAMGWTTTHQYTDNGLEAKVFRTDGTQTHVIEENTYDAAGNLIREVTNNGATTVEHVFDAVNRETSTVADPAGLKRSTSVSYDADDRAVATTQKDASGTVMAKAEALYDVAGRMLAQTTYLTNSGGASPVGRWKLADGAGLKAADSAGNSPATAGSGVSWSDERGGSAVFAGTDAMTTPGAVVDTRRDFSVSAWVKLADTDRLHRAVSGGGGEQQSPFDLAYDKESNRWRFKILHGDVADSAGTLALSTTVPAAGRWTHLTGTYDASAGTAKLYVDGNLEATANGRAFGTAASMVLGAGMWNGDLGSRLKGGLSDVQVYQQALSATEVADVTSGAAPSAERKISRTSYTYDADDNVVSATDPNGNTSYTAYDEDNNVVKTTAPAALSETGTSGSVLANAVAWTGYNTFGEVTDSKDANGNWSLTYYDADGRPTLQRMPAYTPPGSSTPITPETISRYNASGQLETVTDPNGGITRFEYDQLDRLSKQTAVDGGVTTYAYDLAGDVLSVTDATGAVSTSTYDYLGRQLTSTDLIRQDNTAATTRYSYGFGGWLSETTSPTGVKQSTTYSPLGETLTVKDGANNVTTLTYDGAGQVVRSTLPDNTYTTTSYDLAGRATKSAAYNAAGTLLQDSSTEYDAAGNVVATIDGRKTRTTFDYDATGMLVRERQPISASDAIETTFGYDLEGNRTRFTDGRGNAFFTTYNAWGLRESQIEPSTPAHPDPADRTFTVVYDKTGRPVKQLLPGGVSVTNTYDAMGLLTKQSGAGAEVDTADRSFEYDKSGRLTKFSGDQGTNTIAYDDRDLPTSITGPSGNSSFTYNPDGAIASRTDAAGTTSFRYDTAGRLDKLTNTAKGVDQTYSYNKLSAVTKIAHGTGNSRNFSYDDLHRLTSDELKTGSGASIAKIEYGWNANGDLTSKKTSNFGGTTTTNTYDYDLADRLTSWNNGTATTVYSYDRSGNRIQNGGKQFTYDARNRLLTGDNANYSYTPRGTLRAVNGVETKTDAFGQVITQGIAGGGAQNYRYDAFGRAIRDGFSYTGLDNDLAADGEATYIRGTANEVIAETSGATTRYAWTDIHDDIVGQFTATGTTLDASVVYDPLGKVIASAGAMIGNLGYQSEWTDQTTNRVNMAARWYNTATGQFDTRDTANNNPVPDSVNANRYQYGDANPLTVTDPTGHWGVPSWMKSAARTVTSTVSSGWNSASSAVSSAWNTGYSYARATYNYGASKVKSVYKAGVKKIKKVYHKAKRVYNKVKKAVKKHVRQWASKAKRFYKKAVRAIKKHTPKWVKKAYNKAKNFVKKTAKAFKQAAKKTLSAAKRVVKKTVSVVKDAAKATKKWVVENKDTLLEVAAIGGAILAGMACTAVTAGAGAIACMVGAGALINLAKDSAQGDIHSLGDALGSMGTGALSGLAGGAGGMIASKVGTMVAGKVGTGLVGRLATEATENGVDEVFNQAITTGRVDLKSAAMGVIPGMSAFNRKSQGGGGLQSAAGLGLVSSGGGGGGCSRRSAGIHSFDPDTRVLMGDWSKRPIKDVKAGDLVMAAAPTSGTPTPKMVEVTHLNTDHEFSDVTVKDRNGRGSVLNTTQNHPFWNATDKKWSYARDLKPGDELKVAGRGKVRVSKVKNFAGTKEMHDLTVADIHTYYVIAGTKPVLVHNNDPAFANRACDVPRLERSAQRINRALDPIAQSQRDTVVMSTQDGPDLVASGVRDVDPRQRAELGGSELEARLPGQHAEVTANERAKDLGLRPRALSSYPHAICPACRQYLEEEGYRITDDGMSAVMRTFRGK